ncbi:asparagine synthase-related protein [Erythrobacter sp. HKB08]|uniref:asparagine synthase-related protein n=1 Tax=Erythrobacter sp. HKB08 TaxID=2502843 RepID=UPI0013E8AFF2|nr:asparagine synthase-related protein [Erythrobacter sp. HKB08]
MPGLIAALHGWANQSQDDRWLRSLTARFSLLAGVRQEEYGWLASGRLASRSECLEGSFARHVVVLGAIDEAADIRAGSAAETYAQALTRYGPDADAHIVGNYAAIALLADGSVRLARSPWDAPPLHFTNDARRMIAAPRLELLFAGGAEAELDYDRIVDQLAYDFRDNEVKGWYRDIFAVPLGSVVTCRPGEWSVDRWYDPVTFLSGERVPPSEAAGQAYTLLQQAARHALRRSDSPALALSGGLDSPLAACALLDELPPDHSLTSITFRPHADWDGECAPGSMGDEWPLVQDFAAMHPRIAAHEVRADMDRLAEDERELLRAMRLFAPGIANIAPLHTLFREAKALGCDAVFTAGLANQSYSQDGRWAYVEKFRHGRWASLLRQLSARPGDNRSLLRKFAALSVLPQLPASARKGLRALVHPGRGDMLALLTPLSRQALAAQRSRAAGRGGQSDWDDQTFPRSREEAVRHDHYAADGEGADVEWALGWRHGLAPVDVTAYRPLIEFCLGLPTASFTDEEGERSLARQMALGRLPEAQRTNTDYGAHGADWLVELGERRDEYREALKVMRDHPFLSRVIDLERVERLVDDWPERPSQDIDEDWPRMLAIPRAILAARFIGVVEGRNDL